MALKRGCCAGGGCRLQHRKPKNPLLGCTTAREVALATVEPDKEELAKRDISKIGPVRERVCGKALPQPGRKGEGREIIRSADNNLVCLRSRLEHQDSQPCPFHRHVIFLFLVPARRWAAGGSRRLVLSGCARLPAPLGSASHSVCL